MATASAYPGAEQDAQRILDQIEAMMRSPQGNDGSGGADGVLAGSARPTGQPARGYASNPVFASTLAPTVSPADQLWRAYDASQEAEAARMFASSDDPMSRAIDPMMALFGSASGLPSGETMPRYGPSEQQFYGTRPQPTRPSSIGAVPLEPAVYDGGEYDDDNDDEHDDDDDDEEEEEGMRVIMGQGAFPSSRAPQWSGGNAALSLSSFPTSSRWSPFAMPNVDNNDIMDGQDIQADEDDDPFASRPYGNNSAGDLGGLGRPLWNGTALGSLQGEREENDNGNEPAVITGGPQDGSPPENAPAPNWGRPVLAVGDPDAMNVGPDGHTPSTRVELLDVARGVRDDGDTVLVFQESAIVSGGTRPYVNLNGDAYETAPLLAYLYAEEPAEKSVPHTQQRLTQAQVNAIMSLMADGHMHIIVPPDVNDAAYALSRPLDPADGARALLPSAVLHAIDAHLEHAIVDHERSIGARPYYVAALKHYAVEIAMAIGWDYKPAINFGIARYINVAGTPLLAEEGGLLPDEVPRLAFTRKVHAASVSTSSSSSSTTISAPPPSSAATADNDNDGGDSKDADVGHTQEITVVETRDEATTRHRNMARHRRTHPPMGMDLELVRALLRAEADGVESSPAALDEMRCRLRMAIGDRIKPSKIDRKIDRYAVPWAYGICCALDKREVAEVLESPRGAASVRERVSRAWAKEVGIDTMAQSPSQSYGPSPSAERLRPLAPYLSDEEFVQRLEQLESALLAAIARVIPVEARGKSDLDAGEYIIYESNLAVGTPLSPPMGHSLAQKVMRLQRQAGTRPRPCDLAPKPPSIVFVRDCQNPSPPPPPLQ